MATRILVPEEETLFAIDPERLFPQQARLEAELGAGRGDFIIDYAAAHPDRNFVAVELAASVARVLAIRAARRKLDNLRVARMDARTLINLMLPSRSLSACHIYFPDPWPALSQQKHRLFSPSFTLRLRRVLAADAPVHVATDVEAYGEQIFAMLESAGFRRAEIPAPGATTSGFARKYIAEGRSVFSATFMTSTHLPGQSASDGLCS